VEGQKAPDTVLSSPQNAVRLVTRHLKSNSFKQQRKGTKQISTNVTGKRQWGAQTTSVHHACAGSRKTA